MPYRSNDRRTRSWTGGKQRQIRERLARYRALRSGSRPRRIPPVAVPSFFTLMNLFSGFLAIVQVFEGRFELACWLIVLAAFFDVLDGMLARLTNANSVFGVELDSLADIVSFGTAPSILVYFFGLHELGALGLLVAALPAICGAVRLARFNVTFTGEKKDDFVGLPIPGMAAFIVALILNFDDAAWFSRYGPSDLTILAPVVFVLSFLMVSNIPFDAVPKPSPAYIRAHPRKFGFYLLAFLLVVFLQQVGLLFVFTAYLLYNIARAILHLYREIMETPTEDELAGDGPDHSPAVPVEEP